MFCPRCGAQLPDGSAFCGYCGEKFNAEPRVQPNPKPSNTSFGPDVSKQLLITLLLTLALLFSSLLVPVMCSFHKVPAVKMILNVGDFSSRDIDNIMDESKDAYKDLEDFYEKIEGQMDRTEQKAIKKITKTAKKLVRTPSLMNIQRFSSVCEKNAKKVDGFFLNGISFLSRDLEDVQEVMGIVIWIAIGMFILPAIFTVLAGLKKSMGLTITALVFLVIFQLLLCGFLWVILSLAVYIYQAVLCHKLRKGAGQTATA